MRLHILQHVHFEAPAHILSWAGSKRLSVSKTDLFKTHLFPNLSDFDALAILGGPMGVHDEGEFPWLYAEKRFIEKAILMEKKILGICLGAQLLASVLGARIIQNPEKEIGWYPVHLTPEGQDHPLIQDLPASFVAFHWHGDTFEIPEHGRRIGKSDACQNQGFVMNNHIIGLQFHLESTKESVESLVLHGGHEIEEAKWIQDAATMTEKTDQHGQQSNGLMESILDRWIR